MRRYNECWIGQCWVLAVFLAVGMAGCGSSETADGEKGSDGEGVEKAVAKEFDLLEEGGRVSKGVYLLDGDTLKIVSGFPGTPRVVDLASKDEMVMTMKRKSGEDGSIVGKWTVSSASMGGQDNPQLANSVVEFTEEKMIHTISDGQSHESGYRLGGVPAPAAKPSAAEAEVVAALKAVDAEVFLGEDGKVESIRFTEPVVTDELFAKVAALSSVKTLDMYHVEGLTLEGIAPIAKMTSLETLMLSCEGLTDEWLAPLGSLKGLKSLILSGNRELTMDGAKHLVGLTSLVELRLGDTKVGDGGVALIAGLTGLERLELKRADVTDSGVVHLKGMTKLRELQLSGRGTNFDEIHSGITDASVEVIKGMTQLEILDLGSTKITDAGLAQLGGLKNLEMLVIVSANKITDEGVAKFREMVPGCEVHGPKIGR